MPSTSPRIGYSISGRSAVETAVLARRAEDAGVDLLALGDNQRSLRDVYALLAMCATATSRIRLGPLVTNPLTRHPSVTAAAIATVEEIAPGRTFLALGRGNASVKNAGLPRATVMQMRDAVVCLEEALRPQAAHALPWAARPVPVIVHVGGPRAIDVAVELADGVLFRWGDLPEATLADRLAKIRTARAASHRAAEPFEVWTIVSTCVTSAPAVARGKIDLAHRARSLPMAEWPPHLVAAARDFRRAYDFERHASKTDHVNQRLLEDLGLSEFIVDRYAFIGDGAAVGRRVSEAAALGIDTVILALVDPPDRPATEEDRLADIASVKRALRREVAPAARQSGKAGVA